MTNKSISTLKEAQHLLTYTRSAEKDIIFRLTLELQAALEGLYLVYVNIGEDTDGARNAKELFGPWVGFDPATHVPNLVADFRKMMEEDYDTDLEREYERGFNAGLMEGGEKE